MTSASPTRRTRVAVLYGGRSAEHEISLISARFVARNLDPARFDVVPIGITQEGRWLLPGEGLKALEAEEIHGEPVVAEADRQLLRREPRAGELTADETGTAGTSSQPAAMELIDVVFPVLHGPLGEDGTIQGLLELAGVPYVGAGVLGSSIGMDKIVQKAILKNQGIPVAWSITVRRHDWKMNPEGTVGRIETEFDYPVFVKPSNLGSSVGISKAHDRDELESALDEAGDYDLRILVEEAVEGMREVECAVIGNEEPEVSVIGEVRPTHEFYDYEAKYLVENGAELIIPADLSETLAGEVRRLAREAYMALDCAGMARVDFFVCDDPEQIWLNEINTIPGFTQISMFPRLWEASGLPPGRLVERLIQLAIDRFASRRGLKTQR